MRATILCILLATSPVSALAADSARDAPFVSIDGGTLSDWRGQVVLVVNTASRCAYTGQYDGLQRLHDTYGAQGFAVLAVPSSDFNQELDSAEAVKDFCETTFQLTLPMTDITPVRGAQAHPFYGWVESETGFAPRWNFDKVLIGRDGQVAATFRSQTAPDDHALRDAVTRALR